jgi:hypothetical protein
LTRPLSCCTRGRGFGAFHHFISQPFASGGFTAGSPDRVARLSDAGLAAAYAVHQLRRVQHDAAANPTLCHVVAAPLEQAAASLDRLAGPLSSGQISGGDLDQLSKTIEQVQQSSAQAGTPVPDHIPSLAELG